MNNPIKYSIPIIDELCRITDNMYRLGWDERNGGNISVLLNDEDVLPYINELPNKQQRELSLSFDASELSGRIMLATATGRYFKNISTSPAESLGIIRFSGDGRHADVLWGFENGGLPTSELPSHVMSHLSRLKQDKNHRVVMHAHPTNLVAMTFVHNLDEKEFTRSLWKRHTECIMVFPDGIGVLPWMLFGCESIGIATAIKMRDFRLVVWAHHGIFGTGNSLDDAFGLLECAEKAAEIYMKTAGLPILQEITDEQLKATARHFKVTPKAGWLL